MTGVVVIHSEQLVDPPEKLGVDYTKFLLRVDDPDLDEYLEDE